MFTSSQKILVKYCVTVDDKVVETNHDSAPLELILGQRTFPEVVHRELLHLQIGERKRMTLEPQLAYGHRMAEKIVEVPKPGIPGEDSLKVDDYLNLENKRSREILHAKIIEVKDETLVLDLNHPLAGKTVQFDVQRVDYDEWS